MKIERAFFIPDTHIGVEIDDETSHDKKAFKLVLDIIKEIQPDHLFILGDFGEFHATTSHPKHPQVRALLKDELFEVYQGLKQVSEAAPNAKKHFIEGNHSFRVARYIQTKCPELFDTIHLNELLKLDELGFEFHRYGPNQLVKVAHAENLYARHEPYGSSPQASAKNAGVSLIHGHDHKLHRAPTTRADGVELVSIGAGCLVNKNCKIYEYVKNRANWQLGFVSIDILPDGTWFEHLVQIKDYKCSFDGSIWVADE